MKVLRAITLLCLLVTVNEAKVFEKCELAKLLYQHGMDGYYGYSLGNWVCMAYYESGFDSRKEGPENSNGSNDYGIFQFNSHWWCSNGVDPTTDACGCSCYAFIDDNITDDINCAKRVVQDPNRMDAWVAWVNNCKGTDLSYWTYGCNLSA